MNLFLTLQPGPITRLIIEKYSPKRREDECKLTMGYDRIGYHYVFFGVPKDSPYQEELHKELVLLSFIYSSSNIKFT